MERRVVEITESNRFLTLNRGFLTVYDTSKAKTKMGKVALDDIAAVITTAHGLTFSNNIVIELSKRSIPLVLCGSNFLPSAIVWPCEKHHLQAKRYSCQIRAKENLKKRLWKAIVKSKLTMQAQVLDHFEIKSARIRKLATEVLSADKSNREAVGAKYYWKNLFDKDFRRDREKDGINAFLNYGYTVLRAATARAIIAAGLHPTLGLHHSNEGNAMQLVDDLMEPYRPAIDKKVKELFEEGFNKLNRDVKQELVKVIYQPIGSTESGSLVVHSVNTLANSLAQIYMGERQELLLPEALKNEARSR